MEAAGLHLFTSISFSLRRMRMVMVVVILAVQLRLFTKLRVLMWTRGFLGVPGSRGLQKEVSGHSH